MDYILLNGDQNGHDFRKANLVTLNDKDGTYDLYRCSRCGMEGKRRGIGSSSLRVKVSKECPKNKYEVPKFIEITEGFNAVGEPFKYIKPGRRFKVQEPSNPMDKPNGRGGVWIWGNLQKVRILAGEFKPVDSI